MSLLNNYKYQIQLALLLVFGWGGALSARAQEAADSAGLLRSPLVLGLYAQGSFILPHTYAIRHLVASHPTGVELNLQRQTTGAASWHGWYKYPKVGLALVYYDFHNPTLGRAFAGSAYISKAFLRTPRHDISFRVGAGVAYLSNPYSQESNHKNTINSSAVNAMLQMRLEYDYAITPQLGLLVGLGLNHFSNGATTRPNFGINLPTLVLGLNYHQQRPAAMHNANAPMPADVGQNFYNVSTSIGFVQRNESDKTKYLVNSITGAIGRRVNRKSSLLAGVEGFYDRSLKATLQDTTRAGVKQPDVKKAGVFVGHELLFGRLAFVSHLGFYVYAPYKSSTPYYERLGLKYHFTDLLFGAVDLKIHRGAADVIEFKAGVRL